MKNIVVARYIDALYFKKNEKLDFSQFKTHIAIGELVDNNNIIFCFTKKNKKPNTGLLLTQESIVFKKNKKNKLYNFNYLSKIGVNVGIYWNDIVYFVNGKIPEMCTKAYTEGKLFSVTSNAIIIKDPKTILLKKKVINHPADEKQSYCVIPKSFVTDIQFYDK
ncbi:MAG: hypothetical protein WCW47_00315 [Candidatus Paceibacterota bacterium]|jgi:hypothetical protein